MASKFNVNIQGAKGTVVVGDNSTLTIHESEGKTQSKQPLIIENTLNNCTFCTVKIRHSIFP